MPGAQTDSISLLTYPSAADIDHPEIGDYANGFVAETERFGVVVITCAHVFKYHPGPDKKSILVDGHEARLIYDACKEHGVDIAIVELPESLRKSRQKAKLPMGRSARVNRVFFSHAWARHPGDPSQFLFRKAWGTRVALSAARRLAPGEATSEVWELQVDQIAERGGTRVKGELAGGWSGAPVLNLRPKGEESRVVGVLNIVKDEGRGAFAISIAPLDFLRPADEERDEAWVRVHHPGVLASLVRRLDPRRRGAVTEIEFCFGPRPEPSLYEQRMIEVTDLPSAPPVPWFRSRFDVASP